MPQDSPDPPKEEPEAIGNVEDGFVPIASTDDEDDSEDSGMENDGDQDVNGNGVTYAAHYQLLIPFPESSNHDDNSLEETDELPELSIDIQSNQSAAENSNEKESHESESKKHTNPERREITMEEEKIEKIKTVMQNFSLPSTAVPTWASEIDEDQWKSKLFETINKTTK